MKYQDLVIKDEKFVGKFEEMYQKFSDPWNLLKINKQGFNLNYHIIYNYCEQWGFADPYGLDNCEAYTNYDNLGDFFVFVEIIAGE